MGIGCPNSAVNQVFAKIEVLLYLAYRILERIGRKPRGYKELVRAVEC
jgi:hypothetical protein